MGTKLKVGKTSAFPGCCGVTALKAIDPKSSKAAFMHWLKDQNYYYGLGGLAVTVSKTDALAKSLVEYGFKELLTVGNECIWYRRIRFRGW